MKLLKLEISTFKNLRDFSIDFSQALTTVLLGQNGTGKSNLLEALIIIFRDLDLGEPPAFKYKLEYECRNREIHIDADPARSKSKREQVQITLHSPDSMLEIVPYNNQFYGDSERRYLPSYVFGYYSGPSNRMEKHFDKHQERFYRDLLRGEDKPLRPLLYARPVHSQFALLSFFTEEEQHIAEGQQSIREFLDELLGIHEMVSVLFVMQQPPWNSKQGDERFWNARGVVGRLLAQLYEIALAPMRLKVRVTPEFASTTTREHLYLYLRGEQDLRRLFKHYESQQEFFKALESTYISKILSEVRIRLQRRNADGSLTFRDLSEGEQQLLMVLGLLRFTKEDEALFLLDEPDTHLNPAWSVQYLEFMRRIVGDQPGSQVIMTTHNPLVVAELERQHVRIMQRDNEHGRIFVETPRENPRGMGVAGILTSELFGLRSALDLPTQEKLDKQRLLAAKDELTQEEQKQLSELTDQLDALGFTAMEDDPLYGEFIKKFTAREDPALLHQVVLTPQQQEERMRLVDEIISELIAEGHWR